MGNGLGGRELDEVSKTFAMWKFGDLVETFGSLILYMKVSRSEGKMKEKYERT